MARSAQQRLDRASALGADDSGAMERPKVAAIRRGDKARGAAYNKGRDAGTRSARRHKGAAFRRADVPEIYDPDDEQHAGEHASYHQGVADSLRDERRATVRQAAGNSISFDGVDDGAGFLLGLIGYALVLAYLRNGPAGVKGWMRAKFLNEPTAASKAKPRASTAPPGPTIIPAGTPWSPQPTAVLISAPRLPSYTPGPPAGYG